MSLSEDEGLLNSDSEGMTEEKSLQKDNSITAIISDEVRSAAMIMPNTRKTNL